MEEMSSDRCYSIDKSPFGSHIKILNFINPGSKVLDIGAGGYFAEFIKKKGCIVYSLEKDPKSADLNKNFSDAVIIADIEDFEADLDPESFDSIIYGDVLEHLKEPQNALRKLDPLLNENGHIIVSIPNIAQIWVRFSLLFGKFEYKERGVLDKTHLRFFTYKTATNLIEDSGYVIIDRDFTIHPFWPDKIAPVIYRFTKLFPALFAVQFIFKARKDTGFRE